MKLLVKKIGLSEKSGSTWSPRTSISKGKLANDETVLQKLIKENIKNGRNLMFYGQKIKRNMVIGE